MPNKYFMFDSELWEEGFFCNCSIKSGSLYMDKNSEILKSVYISSALDSGEKETVWHRMRMSRIIPEDCVIMFSYFVSDEQTVNYKAEKINITNILHDTEKSVQYKLSIFDELWMETKKNPNDILLCEGKGRYLWFKIELISYGATLPRVDSIRIDLPMDTIVNYLPEFYSSDKQSFLFLRRYLGIYQSLIYDIQEDIDNVAKYIDADSTDNKFLEWLTQWVALDNTHIWQNNTLRLLIKNSFRLYAEKGTKQGLIDIIRFYIGVSPIIAETYEIIERCGNGFYNYDYKRLYGDNIYSFFILIDEKYILSRRHFVELKKIVELYKPINTSVDIVVLKPFIVLGQHSYIGLNSSISKNSALELTENTTLPFNTTILE